MALKSKNDKIPITGYSFDIKGEAFLSMMLTARIAQKYGDLVFRKEAPISRIKYIALKVLNYQSMTPSELAASIYTERHNITTLLRRMKKEGLITTKREQKDERRIHLSITKRGREALSQALIVGNNIHGKLMLSINEDEAAMLKRISEIILQNAFNSWEEIT